MSRSKLEKIRQDDETCENRKGCRVSELRNRQDVFPTNTFFRRTMVKPDFSTTAPQPKVAAAAAPKLAGRPGPCVGPMAWPSILKSGDESGAMTNFENPTVLNGAARSDVKRKLHRRDRAVLLIPDGVGVRNFILSNFLHELDALADVHVLHAIPDDLLEHFKRYGPTSI